MEGVGGADIGGRALGHGEHAPPIGGGNDHRAVDRQAIVRHDEVYASRQGKPRGRAGLLQRADGVDPGAGGVDDHPGGEAGEATVGAGQPIGDLDGDGATALHNDGLGAGVVDRQRPGGGGAADVGQGQAGVVGEVFRIDHRAGQVLRSDGRFALAQFGQGPDLVPAALGDAAELLEGPQAGAQLGDGGDVARGDHEGGLAGEMWGDGLDDLALAGRLADQRQIALGEIAQAAVDHLG